MSISSSLRSALAALATGAFASLLLVTSHGAAVAVIGTPPTVVCTGTCQSCLESEVTPNGPRCVKCGVDPKCSADPGLASENTELLKATNAYRASHGTPALTWSGDLAQGAQQWASACTKKGDGFAHSPNAFSAYGENLRWGYGAGFTGPQSAVASWYNEIKRYKFDDPITSYKAGDTDSSKEVRHFTQLIWRDTKQVGCGVAMCGQYEFWVCRYSPPGNQNGEQKGVLDNEVPPVGGIQKTESTGGGIKPQNVPVGGGNDLPHGGHAGDWSVFAANKKGLWGYGVNYDTEAEALTAAVNGCGGPAKGCAAFYSAKDKCVAYAESRQGGYWYAAGSAGNEQQADQNALKYCQSGTAPPGSCKVSFSKCR